MKQYCLIKMNKLDKFQLVLFFYYPFIFTSIHKTSYLQPNISSKALPSNDSPRGLYREKLHL